jgi:hypothetical protein
MRLAVIDASPVGGGPVTHALAHAASQLPDATIVRVRVFDLFGRVCASCTACARTGRCSRHDAALDEAAARLASADALLVGCSGHFHAHDPRCHALLERLVGAFGRIETTRGLADGARHTSRNRKRAALVLGTPPMMGVPVLLGMLPSAAAGVWRMLERADTAIVGCATVGTRWAGPASRDCGGESARRLGRLLALPAAPHIVSTAPRPPSAAGRHALTTPRLNLRRVAASLLGVVRAV